MVHKLPQEVVDDGELIARVVRRNDLWEGDGLQFLSGPHEFIQIGTWRYQEGTVLADHAHNSFERSATITQEAVFVIKGALRARLFNREDVLVEELKLDAGDLLVCLAGGHGYEVLDDDTRVLEFKNGPYAGPEMDRRRFNSADRTAR